MITFGYDLETTGKDPFQHKIITIQYRRDGTNFVYKIWDYENNEKKLILNFLKNWKTIPRSRKLGGDLFVVYNFKFDGPFLLTRCILNGIYEEEEWRQYLWENIIHGPAILDLYQLLGDQLLPFAKVRGCLMGSYAEYKSADIPKFFERKEYEKIEKYVNDELCSLEKIYYAIIKEPFWKELQKLRKHIEGM
jgi:hypothetical protein